MEKFVRLLIEKAESADQEKMRKNRRCVYFTNETAHRAAFRRLCMREGEPSFTALKPPGVVSFSAPEAVRVGSLSTGRGRSFQPRLFIKPD